jgi:serine O-acetyltransferase
VIAALNEARARRCFPPEIRSVTERLGWTALSLLFPHFADGSEAGRDVARGVEALESELLQLEVLLEPFFPGGPCHPSPPAEASAPVPETKVERARGDVTEPFLSALPALHDALMLDADAICQKDPAARSVDEVILTYPGFFAIAVHRLAHALHGLGLPLVPRLLSEFAHRRTGVDIHPAAKIGPRFVIDHGTGVVVGETTLIGKGVSIYQGVTLGALQVEKHLSSQKRHPTIEDHVVIYANATILGGNTVIGHDSIVGGNAFVTQSVPPFSSVTHRSEIRRRTSNGDELVDFVI